MLKPEHDGSRSDKLEPYHDGSRAVIHATAQNDGIRAAVTYARD
jgi:hypothetical protein